MAPKGAQMKAIPTPMIASGSVTRQIGVLGVISIDSHSRATARMENPDPMIGRGCARSTIRPTNGASTPLATAIGAVSIAARVGVRAHTACA